MNNPIHRPSPVFEPCRDTLPCNRITFISLRTSLHIPLISTIDFDEGDRLVGAKQRWTWLRSDVVGFVHGGKSLRMDSPLCLFRRSRPANPIGVDHPVRLNSDMASCRYSTGNRLVTMVDFRR